MRAAHSAGSKSSELSGTFQTSNSIKPRPSFHYGLGTWKRHVRNWLDIIVSASLKESGYIFRPCTLFVDQALLTLLSARISFAQLFFVCRYF